MSYYDEDLDLVVSPKPKTSTFTKVVIIALIILGIVILFSLFAASSNTSQIVNAVTRTFSEFVARFRQLWQEHVQWTREVISAIADGIPADITAASARLLKNVPDMMAVFGKFYPQTLVAPLSALFTEHLTIAAELVSDLKRGDMIAAANSDARWYANANALSNQLNKMNPQFWKKAELNAMFKEHLDLTKQEAVQRIQNDYAGSITTYNKIQDHALKMSDYFTTGLAKQFPARFAF